MHLGQPVRELIVEPVVDPVPADTPEAMSVAIHPASAQPDRGATGGPDDPGAASPARV